ncbi:Uncharacterized protein SCG7109_AH_00120 [Chlamydiales bacterium SCGC AG-110-M15]|nr:Uncharacterized protein SCG7109_AH_00120 [Chlamydiales bacterium SCGC AG-110-M15]
MRFDRGDIYQLVLTGLATVALLMFGVFVYREMFPEYKEYQNTYVNLEEFRASVTGEPVPPFKGGIKQIVMAKDDKGPEDIDRCTSCHVALKFSHFSPTKIAYDLNGNMIIDENGHPQQVENDDYVWGQLDRRVAELRDESVLSELRKDGELGIVKDRLNEADYLESLLEAPHNYDMKKALSMHPLIGRETRPFQYHSAEEFGCTVCHNGNGNSVVTERAHGPVIDGQYHASHEGHKLVFTESDPENDPPFSKVFNSKPSHGLLFQTTPLFVGPLMQAKCAQCHQSGKEEFMRAVEAVDIVAARKDRQVDAIRKGLTQDKHALLALLEVHSFVRNKGYQNTIQTFEKNEDNYSLSTEERKQLESRLDYLRNAYASMGNNEKALVRHFEYDMGRILGSDQIVQKFLRLSQERNMMQDIDAFLDEQKSDPSSERGQVFKKLKTLNEGFAATKRVKRLQEPLLRAAGDPQFDTKVSSDSELLLASYLRGKELYFNVGCYACHRIDGLSRGQVGPDLTKIGRYYPWYIKEAIVWPQSNLKTSTMPNFRLDHDEIQDIVTFLLAQQQMDKGESEVQRKILVKEWEGGRKTEWEKPIPPGEVKDLKKSMMIFATEGCASCHRLKGFESSIGYRSLNETSNYKAIYRESEWFEDLFPEHVLGSQIVRAIEESGEEIDRHIVDKVRSEGILEDIEKSFPRLLPSFYAEFKYAMRAKDHHFDQMLKVAEDEESRRWVVRERELYLDRVRRVMMMYIQEYGLGRDVAPRLHWSATYRDEEWLMGHFKKPMSYIAKSIMPPMPFDESKFYALTYMLQDLAEKNRVHTREVWNQRGFDPEQAFEWHCAQCHGEEAHGNGSVAQWIYPVPKNLRDPTFMRNLTRERAVFSIKHGVSGTPMPPWGEMVLSDAEPVLKSDEIEQLVDWLFLKIPGGRVIRDEEDVKKWKYDPDDVLREMMEEGDSLQKEKREEKAAAPLASGFMPTSFLFSLGANLSRPSKIDTSAIFDEVESPINVDGKAYYIKREFYTPEHLVEGERLFVENCAHCHGKEAAGNGLRSVTMEQAKPRMLTNLPWLKTRDDLRLLRSIKYGVPGTAMTTWGDKTSTLQRMQMLMFIRSLSDEREFREDLASTLYNVFDVAEQSIVEVRAIEGRALNEVKDQYDRMINRREELYQDAKESNSSSHLLSKTYSKELSLMERLKLREELDDILKNLSEEIKRERALYEEIGSEFILKDLGRSLLSDLNEYILLSKDSFFVQKGMLVMTGNANAEADQQNLLDKMLQSIDSIEGDLETAKEVIHGKIASPERNMELEKTELRLKAIRNIKGILLSRVRRIKQAELVQRELYNEYKEKASSL